VHVLPECDPDTVQVLLDPEPDHWAELAECAGVVVLTSDTSGGAVLEAVRLGADAVVDISEETDCVVEAVKVVRSGGTLLSPAHARVVADALRQASGSERVMLTRRERDILGSIELGHSVKQTARHLGISPKTVENLQSRLFRKLGVRNRAQAIAVAHRKGLLDETPQT